MARLGLVLLFAAVLSGCSGSEDGEARDASASDGAAADSGAPDSGGASCCPIDLPVCGCVRTGGTRPATGDCPQLCDSDPFDWTVRTDTNGCLYLEVPPGSTCLAGPDAGTSTTADGG